MRMRHSTLAAMAQGLSTVALIVIAATLVWAVVRLDVGRESSLAADATPATVQSTAATEPSVALEDFFRGATIVVHGTGIATETVELTPGVWTAEAESTARLEHGVLLESMDASSHMSWPGDLVVFTVGDFSEAELYPGPTHVRVVAGEDAGWTVRLRKFRGTE